MSAQVSGQRAQSARRRVWRILKVVVGGALVISGMIVFAAIGGFLSLRYSARPAQIRVPELIGQLEEEARDLLGGLDLRVRVVGERTDRRLGKGRVLEQDPPPGSWVKAGRTVKIVRSLGEAEIEVPDLTGRSAREVRLELQRLELRLGAVTYARLPGPEDRVVAQQPRPGTKRSKGEPVDLLVSRGGRDRKYVMPDLVGRSAEVVQGVLERAGLRAAGLRRAYRPDVPPGIVVAQKPDPGGPVGRRSAITLTVSQ